MRKSTGSIRTLSLLLMFAITLVGIDTTRAADEADSAVDVAPRIQMAILLDTSGSMRGLVNQARSELWKVVNQFATAKLGDKQPTLEVALYEYGRGTLGNEAGFMRQILPLTDDLDKVSEELFKLEIGGSKEYCGQVIHKAAIDLKWSESNRDIKTIFIAGNEGFGQGPADFREACSTAANAGITVSTIFCGPNEQGVKQLWLEASRLADGSYMSINHNQQPVAIDAPQDKQLVELNTRLNKTYVAFGSAKKREEALERQVAQDANASASSPASLATRIQSKGSHLYNNARWDLCDACRLGKVKIEDVKVEDLPEELRKMSVEERKVHIEQMIKEREEIQKQISSLSESREKYVAEERKKLAANEDETLDAAIISAVRKQAETKKFTFEK